MFALGRKIAFVEDPGKFRYEPLGTGPTVSCWTARATSSRPWRPAHTAHRVRQTVHPFHSPRKFFVWSSMGSGGLNPNRLSASARTRNDLARFPCSTVVPGAGLEPALSLGRRGV